MSTDLVFEFPDNGQPLRTIVRDDAPWFVAADACAHLGHRMPSDALRWLDESEKGYAVVRTPGGDQRMSLVSESGLYALIFRSKNETAKRFRMWVTSDVLPAIRRTGRYEVEPAGPVLPQSYAAALRELASTVERAEDAERELAIAAPAAEAWNTLASASGDFSVREAAYILNRDPDIDTGQNRLHKTLRDLGLVGRDGVPYANHSSHVRLRAGSYTRRDTGEEVATTQIRITAAGVRYLHKRLGGTRPVAFDQLLREAS